ncbi:MAG TPA: hypothetical protein VG889_07665 [Rhizomicrobium sp.]|nr:hypothetical protein [Rhizomicrobium sp.]
MLSALHIVTAYPLDLSHPVFAHYPAMKFGARGAVAHFARLLEPPARRLIAARPGEWVLASPPVRSLPSGANLICEALSARLGIAAEGLRLIDRSRPFETAQEFAAHGDYAKLDYATRSASQYGDDEVAFETRALAGRRVLFVNDINVTGAQKDWIERVLGRAGPAAIDFLFIVDVAPEIGRRFPHLEDEINRARLDRSDELIAFLRRAELRCTTKLIARLLGHANLERILRAVGAARRGLLLKAMFDDRTYAPEFVAEKLSFAHA